MPREATHRIADKELGLSVDIVESLWAFEHIHDIANVEGVEMKKYLANGYVGDIVDDCPRSDEQQDTLWVNELKPEPLHEDNRAFIDTSESLFDWA